MGIKAMFLALFQNSLTFLIKMPLLGNTVNYCLSWLSGLVRLFTGIVAANSIRDCPRPLKPLILYQYEVCPFCRMVRENFSILALDAIVLPCPRTTLTQYGVVGESRYRPEVAKLSPTGVVMFPMLVDENFEPSVVIQDSSAIIAHVWKHYGTNASKPWNYNMVLKGMVFTAIPSLFRLVPSFGLVRTPSKALPLDFKQLVLCSAEASPSARIIREALDTLELPHMCYNVPTYNYPNRDEKLHNIAISTSSSLSPDIGFFSDPNTGIEFNNDAHATTKYLFDTYGDGKAEGNLSEYSTKGATAAHGTLPGYDKKAT